MTATATRTCVVCGTTESGAPGWGLWHVAFDGVPGSSWLTCSDHKDAVQLVRDGYDRRKKPDTYVVRSMTVEEAKQLSYGQQVKMIGMDGTLRNLKVNGQPQTWKTRPGEVRVPVKYGLKGTGQLYNDGETGLMQQLVVVLS